MPRPRMTPATKARVDRILAKYDLLRKHNPQAADEFLKKVEEIYSKMRKQEARRRIL